MFQGSSLMEFVKSLSSGQRVDCRSGVDAVLCAPPVRKGYATLPLSSFLAVFLHSRATRLSARGPHHVERGTCALHRPLPCYTATVPVSHSSARAFAALPRVVPSFGAQSVSAMAFQAFKREWLILSFEQVAENAGGRW